MIEEKEQRKRLKMRRKGRKSQKRAIKLFFEKEKRLKNYPRYVNPIVNFFRIGNFPKIGSKKNAK